MSHLVAMIIASSGIALAGAGPDHAAQDNTEGKACCPLTAAANEKADSCCDGASSECCSTEVAAEAYDNADWPAHNEDLYSKDFQGQALPVALGKETWISKAVDTTGKVVVLDFWATWCPPCRAASPILDELQKENQDSLAVMAIAGQRDPESDVRSYVAEHEVSYANLYDTEQSVFKPFESKGIPLVVVISTDGIVRWIGNPHDEAFVAAVNKTIAVDPALQALEAQASIAD